MDEPAQPVTTTCLCGRWYAEGLRVSEWVVYLVGNIGKLFSNLCLVNGSLLFP